MAPKFRPSIPSTSAPFSLSTGAAVPPPTASDVPRTAPTDIHALWAQLKSASPNGGGRDKAAASGSWSAASKALTYKQKLLLSSYGLHDEAALFQSYTNAEFNAELERARKHRAAFELTYGSKPATTVLYNITKRIHDGDMPDFHTAMYADIMKLWITSAGSLRADTAIQLIYDFGMDAAEVLDSTQEFAVSVLEAATKARADGKLLPFTAPKRPRSPSDGAADSGNTSRGYLLQVINTLAQPRIFMHIGGLYYTHESKVLFRGQHFLFPLDTVTSYFLGQTGTRKLRKFDEIAAQTLVELVQADDQAMLSHLATAMTNLLGTLWSVPDISRALSELGYVRKKVFTRAFEARESVQLAYRELV
ncbi:hypothetical protein VOLCADRAFT_108189 [Volvox carteri f. nagariensis]|uniref:Uncharacterized protein n=1 Tax=Volvox carteri f. nagariensis TaxID=3068 RepID=D8UIT7_VOLCA|nr:uncharacterized protein VOLCADRAFT_108189 [Volvox carteri f. nagariensis]EFJ40374.1 hypothetical protein VOLCADRAFT_108189 [Volvox carteri f. nagariensis]|eukprot:XP_002958578.1 hypothetical protein VOLCADRAFT_108189 [Volvox carteri f. nagariensis]